MTADGGTSLSDTGTSRTSMTQVEVLQSDLQASDTERGTLVSLPGDVLFDFDKANIRNNAKPTLDKLAELIKLQNPPIVAIEGHTDNKGGDDYNDKLSLERARSVEDYLVEQGVDRAKLRTLGLGEDKPVASNVKEGGGDNPDGRQKNRRVEVILSN